MRAIQLLSPGVSFISIDAVLRLSLTPFFSYFRLRCRMMIAAAAFISP